MTHVRNILFWVHLTIGVAVGAVLLIIATTGMILAFRPQILTFAEKGMYAIELPDEPQKPLGVQVLLDRIHQNDPQFNPTAITLSSDAHSPVVFREGEDNALYVNPYTGSIISKGSSIRQWFEDVEYWHRWLGMKAQWKTWGGNIKRACNVLFLFIIISGLFIWCPPNWTSNVVESRLVFNPKLQGGSRDWNRHNVIGFWCAPFLLVISLTGLIMSYPWANNLLYRITGNTSPVMRQEGQAYGHHRNHHGEDDKNEEAFVGLDVLFTHAKHQVTDWKSIILRLPERPHAPVAFNIEEPGVGHRSQLTLSPEDGHVIKWEPYAKQNSGRKLRGFVRFLHTGEVFGLIGQMIAFLAACGLVVLIWTGYAKAYRRFFTKPSNGNVKESYV